MDSLTLRHSGISTDILLFSNIGLSLTHHYRVHRRGVPDPGSSSVEDYPDVMPDSSRPSRFTFARQHLTRIGETPRRIAPRLTGQDALAAAGSMVFDCRPQVFPGAMEVSGVERSEIRSMTRAGVVTAAPSEHEQSFGGGGGGGDLLSLICQELG